MNEIYRSAYRRTPSGKPTAKFRPFASNFSDPAGECDGKVSLNRNRVIDMKFLFDIVFYPIAFIIFILCLFCKPKATGVFMLVMLVIIIVGSILLYRHRNKK